MTEVSGSGRESGGRKARAWPDWSKAVMTRSPVQAAFHWRASRQLAVLTYHDIQNGYVDRFASQLDHIRREKYPVTLDQVLDAWAGRRRLPHHAVLITFDDGHPSLMDVVLPMLRDRGLPAVAFVVASLIDTTEPSWWEEVIDLVEGGGRAEGFDLPRAWDLVMALGRVSNTRRLAAIAELRRTSSRDASPRPQLTGENLRTLESAGVAIGNHTWSHANLSQCTDEDVHVEVARAHDLLSDLIGHHPLTFAYPIGGWDPRAEADAAAAGYELAFLHNHRLASPSRSHPLRIPRLRLGPFYGPDVFRMMISGLQPALERLRGKGALARRAHMGRVVT
jgi:peptidoglycan/xylan/chitin deacetylase (PgdA/CDA1 family)